jgi:hypothetical protein
MATQAFKDAERKQVSMLAAVEKKTLIWLAQRMPAWVNSDHLTLLGFIAMFVAGLCYWAASWDRRALVAVIAALAVNWFGDSLDGTLARVRNRLRPRYGFYVDHVSVTACARVTDFMSITLPTPSARSSCSSVSDSAGT